MLDKLHIMLGSNILSTAHVLAMISEMIIHFESSYNGDKNVKNDALDAIIEILQSSKDPM